MFLLTVDGNGQGLGEGVTVAANERWDLSERVDLAVVGAELGARLGVDKLDVEAVGLSDSENGLGSGKD